MCRRSITQMLAFLVLVVVADGPSLAHSSPLDLLWTDEVIAKIRNQETLNVQIILRAGYAEVFYDSEVGDAAWGDSAPPYGVHEGDTIRIHGYLATPLFGGPYPGIVIGHGHHGHGSPETAMAVAGRGYVALSIDGPRAGRSTGGPEDTEQAWVSVEKSINVASPAVGFLYHYAYAGMRGLTFLEYLSNLQLPYRNPFRVDRDRLGVIGASMGGQLAYYVNGVDSRVKGAVAIAVAGDWRNLVFYRGAWLYHGLYYYTRMREWRELYGSDPGVDLLNTITNVCLDPTSQTFLDHFDPISYAPTQHGPLLTIIGTHDQYFTVPAINTTYDHTRPDDPQFRKKILLVPNGRHGVLREGEDTETLLRLTLVAHAWFRHAFYGGPAPPDIRRAKMEEKGGELTAVQNNLQVGVLPA
jgi:esterase/lipase